jgi:hypothetical protein
MLRAACLLLALAVAAVTTTAQSRSRDEAGCRDRWTSDRDRFAHCETREETFAGSGLLDVDGSRNGGIRVRGWNRNEVRVISRITAYSTTEARARSLADDIRIETGVRIRATGPVSSRNEHWSVSYEIDVPRDGRLALTTNNGGISIEDFRGVARFTARNGGVTLTDVNGDIRGATTNGGLNIRLSGDRWEGPGLDVDTRNGGVRLTVPDGYSAELETGTVNGRVRVDFPITIRGAIGREIRTTLGSGGALVRAMTKNGGINIERR